VNEMDREEAWTYAVDYAVPPGSLQEKAIQRLLSRTNGNITEALKLMTKVSLWNDEKSEWEDSLAVDLGNGGCTGPNSPRVNKGWNAATHNIEVWYQGEHFFRPPDFEIAWREVFEYIKSGRKRAVQISMF